MRDLTQRRRQRGCKKLAYLLTGKTMISAGGARLARAFFHYDTYLTSPTKQRRQMTKFGVLWRTSACNAKRLLFALNF